MTKILDTLAACTRARVEQEKLQVTPEQMRERAMLLADEEKTFPFEKALRQQDINFICEVKKASPSKGVIAEDFPYLEIAREYEDAGAACISVLTEPEYFMGRNEYLAAIAGEVSIPIIRKDFTVDEYMIYQAKTIGASCVLLICALLDEKTLKKYIGICDSLGHFPVLHIHHTPYLLPQFLKWLTVNPLQKTAMQHTFCSALYTPPFICWLQKNQLQVCTHS